MKRSSHTQQGTALISALFIVMIVSMLATAIAVRLAVSIHQTQLLLDTDRNILNLIANETRAKDYIKTTLQQNLTETFPLTLPAQTFNNARIESVLLGEDGLFNLNSLVNKNTHLQFIRLLHLTSPQLSATQAQKITQMINDWITASNADEIYLRQNPPYRAAHRSMADVSELRLIDGIDEKLYQQLLPFVSALPTGDNKININAAPATLIATLTDGMSIEQASTIVACIRDHHGFNDLQEFANSCVTRLGLNLDSSILATRSKYLRLNTVISTSSQKIHASSLFRRMSGIMDAGQNKISISLLSRSFED
jgi:general secretion pathway protein K